MKALTKPWRGIFSALTGAVSVLALFYYAAWAKESGPAIGLLVKDGEKYRTVMVDHHGGLRYPRLVRIDGVPDRLSAILAPRSH